MKTITVIIAALALSTLASAAPALADGGPALMPSLRGKDLVPAYAALNYDTGIRLRDGLGAHRHVLWPAGWKVCDQQPATGTALEGSKITLTVVKKGEQCPHG
ncbi:PASTA domain-containing protein [Streptomyces sp. NPDC048506]|uniref:PASTA domain-containing protein n=1 Tax=Streptomyces sp. NPDC048506 TaxID=3155028 RepID=UPI003445D687